MLNFNKHYESASFHPFVHCHLISYHFVILIHSSHSSHLEQKVKLGIEPINKISYVGRWVCDKTRRTDVTSEDLYIEWKYGTSDVFEWRYLRRRYDVEWVVKIIWLKLVNIWLRGWIKIRRRNDKIKGLMMMLSRNCDMLREIARSSRVKNWIVWMDMGRKLRILKQVFFV